MTFGGVLLRVKVSRIESVSAFLRIRPEICSGLRWVRTNQREVFD